MTLIWFPPLDVWRPRDWVPRGQKWHPRGPSKRMDDMFNGMQDFPPVREETNKHWDAITDNRAQVFTDSTRFVYDQYLLTSGNAVEVARIECSTGESAIVKGMWTWTQLIDAVIIDPVYPHTGTPYDPLVLNRTQWRYRWRLQLEQIPTDGLGPWWSGPAAHIPGYGFDPLPWWSDGRYLWGTPGSSVFFLVPSGQALRLFFHSIGFPAGPGAQLPLDGVGGRLWGYKQARRVQATTMNALHGWR